jgi:hypothetical protein
MSPAIPKAALCQFMTTHLPYESYGERKFAGPLSGAPPNDL